LAFIAAFSGAPPEAFVKPLLEKHPLQVSRRGKEREILFLELKKFF